MTLNTTAVTMHIAESTDIHENVEAKLLAGGKRPRQFVVLAAMAKSEIDNLAASRFAGRL